MSSWGISLLSPEYFLSLSDGVSIHIRRITMPSFLPARHVCLPVKRPYAIALFEVGYQSTRGHLWKPPLRFWRRPPQSNYPPSSVRVSRVRPQTAKGPYFKDGSTKAGAPASKPPAYPTHRMTKVMLSCSKGSRGLFRPIAGNRHLHRYYNLSSWLRQRPDHYTIRAGRNLPDKRIRYLRTVIVTAAVYRGFNSMLPIASDIIS